MVLVAVPVLRRVALDYQFVDVPDGRKVHRDPVPYLGGVALIAAILAGLLFETRLTPSAAVLAAAALLGTMGLVDDDRAVHPGVRLLAETAAAAVAVAVGLRIHASGVAALDIALTIVWIVGVTNAFNLLDNMDGLATAVASVIAGAVFVIAIFARQPVIATMAAATAGACLGFLAYNRSPATIFMGDAGSPFLGFVLAVLTVDLNLDPLGPPFSFAVPLMLLAVPVLDTTTVTLARLRRRRPVSIGGRDHLSHRLVKRGLSRRAAVAVLVSVEALLALLGLVAGRRVVPLWTAVVATVVVVGALAATTGPVRVYREPVIGLPNGLKLAFVAVVAGVPGLAAPAVAAMLRADGPAREGAAAAERALDALSGGDTERTVGEFRDAASSFAVARDQLHGPLTSIALAIPGLSSNLDAARALVDIGADLSATGAELAALTDSEHLPVQDGQVSLDEVRRLSPLLDGAAAVLVGSHRARVPRPRAVAIGAGPPGARRPRGGGREPGCRERPPAARAPRRRRSAALLPGLPEQQRDPRQRWAPRELGGARRREREDPPRALRPGPGAQRRPRPLRRRPAPGGLRAALVRVRRAPPVAGGQRLARLPDDRARDQRAVPPVRGQARRRRHRPRPARRGRPARTDRAQSCAVPCPPAAANPAAVVEPPAVAGTPLDAGLTSGAVVATPPPGTRAPGEEGVIRRGSMVGAAGVAAVTGLGALLGTLAYLLARRRPWRVVAPEPRPAPEAPVAVAAHAWDKVTQHPGSPGRLRP